MMGKHAVSRAIIILASLLILLASVGYSAAATIRLVPSSATVKPGDDVSVDVVVGGIPEEGLNGVQFRLNIAATVAEVKGVTGLSSSQADAVSVSSPLLMSPPTSDRSGLGSFFYGGKGTNGILEIDNGPLVDGSGLFTFAHTYGAARPQGGGVVATFRMHVGESVAAENFSMSLADVLLMDGGLSYPVTLNEGATVQLRCLAAVPSLSGMTLPDAIVALASAGLVPGVVYEVPNDGTRPLGRVLEQSVASGEKVDCDSPVDLAVNTAPDEVTVLSGMDKAGDESGTASLSWTPSASPDAAGYRIYNLDGSSPVLVQSVDDPHAGFAEVSGLTDGQHVFRVCAFDTFGNESVGATVALTSMDDVPPAVTVSGVSDGAFYNNAVQPVVSATDAHMAGQTATLNGQPYDLTPITRDGDYTLVLTVTDEAGNVSSRQMSFVIDTTAPAIVVSGIEADGYYNVDVMPEITVDDANPGSAVYTMDGVAYEAGTPVATEGTHQLTVIAEDMAGNTSDLTIAFAVDKTFPVSLAEVGEPKVQTAEAVYVGDGTLVTLSASDAGEVASGVTGIEYAIDGLDWTAYVSAFNLSGHQNGVHSVSYRASDKAGNIETPNVLSVVVDNAAPVTVVTVGEPKSESADGTLFISGASTITLSTTDGLSGVASTEYRIDEGDWMVYAPFTVAAEGTHSIEYRSTDSLGNVETPNTLSVVVDNEAPVTVYTLENRAYMDGADVYLTRDSTVTLSASDEISGHKDTFYRIDDGEYGRYSSAFKLAGLENGRHVINFYSVDKVGNGEVERSLVILLIDATVRSELLNLPRVLVYAGPTKQANQGNGSIVNTSDKVWLKEFLDSSIGDADIYYTLAEDKDSFVDAFRSGIYNTFVMLNGAEPFNEPFRSELVEAVNAGAGLLLSGWEDGCKQDMEELFGLKFRGKEGKDEDVHILKLSDSPVSSVQTLFCGGKVVRAELDGGTLAGIVTDNDLPNPVDSVSLEYSYKLTKGDVLTVKLANADTMVDYEELKIDKIPVKAPISDTIGGLYGNLTITGVDPNGVRFKVTANDVPHDRRYKVSLGVLRAGRPVVSAACELDASDGSPLAGGMKAGEFAISDVTRKYDAKGMLKEDLPGLVLNKYGLGKAVFMAVDIAGSTSSGGSDSYGTLLNDALHYLLPAEAATGPCAMVIKQTTIDMNGAGLNMMAHEDLDERLTLCPLFDLVKTEPLDYYFDIDDGGSFSNRYFVRMPDMAGTFSAATAAFVYLSGEYELFDRYDFGIGCPDDSYSLIGKAVAGLEHLRDNEPGHYEKFADMLEDMEDIAAMPELTKTDVEKKIGKLVELIRRLKDDGSDTAELRLVLDEYLRVVQAKYYMNDRAASKGRHSLLSATRLRRLRLIREQPCALLKWVGSQEDKQPIDKQTGSKKMASLGSFV